MTRPRYIASCSGGKDSVATILLAAEKNEPLDEVIYSEVMFDQEISGEVPEHRDYIHQKLKPFVENELGCKFTVLRSDKTYDDVFHHIITRGPYEGLLRGFVWPGKCAVNRDCKMPPLRKYHKAQPDDTRSYVGIALDEPKRLARLNKEKGHMPSCKVWHDGSGCLAAVREIRDALALLPTFQTQRLLVLPERTTSELSHMVNRHPDLFEKLIEWEHTDNLYHRRLTRTETPSEIKARLSGKSQPEFSISNQ